MIFIRIIVNLGKIICFLLLLFIASTIIISFKISSEDNSNPFCDNKYEDITINLDYKEIIEYSYIYDCSTMYFKIKVDKHLSKNEILSLLLSIARQLNGYDFFTHFEITSDSLEKCMYVSINLTNNEISYVGG